MTASDRMGAMYHAMLVDYGYRRSAAHSDRSLSVYYHLTRRRAALVLVNGKGAVAWIVNERSSTVVASATRPIRLQRHLERSM